MTAALGVFSRIDLPGPWTPPPDSSKTPVLIYGGATAVGSFVLKLAVKANIHPLIAVSGGRATFVESLIDPSKGVTIVDYRKGSESLVGLINSVLRETNSTKLAHAFDAVCDHGSLKNTFQVFDPDRGKAACVLYRTINCLSLYLGQMCSSC